MASIEFRVKVIKSTDGTTATMAEVDGSIDASTIQQFQQVMDKLIEKGVKNLILDCTNVKYINSTGLGTLLKYSDSFEAMTGHIAFCRVPSKVMLVMEMLGFNALFNIVPDEATALRSFSGRAAPPASVKVQADMITAPMPQRASAAASSSSSQAAAPVAAKSAAPASDAFPVATSCARCRVTLDVPAAGKYKCPRCGAVLAAEPTGRVRFFASKKGRPIELSVPCNKDFLGGVLEMTKKTAEVLGFDGDSVSSAVETVCEQVIDQAYGGDSTYSFHMAIVPNGNTLTIKIADHGKPFEFGSAGNIHGDKRFSSVIENMDTVEHRVNPKGGNYLTLVKVQQ